MRKKLLAAVFIVLSALILSSCGKYSKGDKLVQQGIEYYNKGDYAAAASAFREAEDMELKRAKPHVLFYYLGESYYKQGKYKESINAHQKALSFKPETFKSLVTVGVCYRKLGDDSKALAAYEKALKCDPENADSVGLYISLGSLYLGSGKPYTAIDYLEKARDIYPDHPAVHANLAIGYAMAYEYEKSDNELALAVANKYSGINEVKDRISEIKAAQASIPQVIDKNGRPLPSDGQ